jgi:4-diphosphocytidyl-2-C-methyl-D-erythritol kinase
MPTLRFRAFAKINLGLRVLGRRPDGYHEVRTVYQAISLADRIEVTLSPRSVSAGRAITVESDDPAVPSGPQNLVYVACQRWSEARRLRRSISIRIEKKIPAGSGLGGASSDAAGVLLALERLTGDHLPAASRFELAAGLGSDVPFFLMGGRAFGCGRGEEVYGLPDLPLRHCLVVFPGVSQSTREAYAALDSRLTGPLEQRSIYSFGKWPQFPWECWEAAENDFEQVVFAKWPELQRLKRQLLRAGAEMASLTGSGSAVYAIFASAGKLASLRKQIPQSWRSFAARTLSRAECQRLWLES